MTSLFCKSGGEPPRGIGKKIFVGRLPPEATAEDLRQYFGRFGRILDVYVPRVRYLTTEMHECCKLFNSTVLFDVGS